MAFTEEGSVAKARDGTEVLVDVGTSQTADLSQNGTALTSSGAGAYELNSARTALTTEGSIVLVLSLDTSVTAGTALNHGDTTLASYGYRVAISAAGAVTCSDDTNGTTITHAASFLNGTPRSCLIHYAWRVDPENAAQYRCHLMIADLSGTPKTDPADVEIVEATFATTPPTLSTEEFSYGGAWNGASLSNPYAVTWCRVGARFESTTEVIGDFVSAFSAPTINGKSVIELMPLPTAEGFGDDGEFAGATYMHAMAAAPRVGRRLISPLAQILPANPAANQDDLSDVYPAGWVIDQPGETEWQCPLSFLKYRPIPNGVSSAIVRLRVQLYDVAAGTPDKVEIRAYCRSVHPGFLGLIGDIKQFYGVGERTNDDTSSGVGGEIRIEVPLVRDAHGWAFLYLACRVNEGTASADTRYKIHSATWDPFAKAAGQDDQFPNDWAP